MLVLTRKENETIRIGNDIEITLIRVRGGGVRVGVDAPRDVKVLRGELVEFATETDVDMNEDIAGSIEDRSTRCRLPMAGPSLSMTTAAQPINREIRLPVSNLAGDRTATIQTVSA